MKGLLRLITLDVTGTLIRFKKPPAAYYAELADLRLGVKIPVDKVTTSFEKAYGKVNKEMPSFGSDSKMWWRRVVHDTFRGCLKDHQGFGKEVDSMADDLYQLFSTTEPYDLYPDAVHFMSTLQDMKRSGGPAVKVGLISNNDRRIVDLLRQFRLLSIFDFLTFSEEAKVSKPSPDIFRLALQRSELGSVQGIEVVHIGDNLHKDVLPAKELGWGAILLDRQGKAADGVNNEVCNDFFDVAEILVPRLVAVGCNCQPQAQVP